MITKVVTWFGDIITIDKVPDEQLEALKRENATLTHKLNEATTEIELMHEALRSLRGIVNRQTREMSGYRLAQHTAEQKTQEVIQSIESVITKFK